MTNTITTYETSEHAWLVLQYGWKPEIKLVRFDNGPLYPIKHKLFADYVARRIAGNYPRSYENTGSWFKTIYHVGPRHSVTEDKENPSCVVIGGGKTKEIANGMTYVMRWLRQSWRNSVDNIHLKRLYGGRCEVSYWLSDGRLVRSQWASYTVAHDYFTKRTRSFAGVPLTES